MKASEKLASLRAYVEQHKARLSAPVPEKHKKHPEAYHAYLRLEIQKAEASIAKRVAEGKV